MVVFSGGLVGKESACNAGDTGDIGPVTESGGCHGKGHDNPLQYSFLESDQLIGESLFPFL